MYVSPGAVIFSAVCLLAVITRHYIVSVLRAAQVEVSATGYIDFLQVGQGRFAAETPMCLSFLSHHPTPILR